MLNKVLSLFPSGTYPLILVSDPDRLLAGEGATLALNQRGFQIIQENDAVFLRRRVEKAQPFTQENPLVLITSGALEQLPHDLYQAAHRLKLSLHQYFPNLAYPVLQMLSPDQIEKLDYCQPPDQKLSRNKTVDYLLRQVFDVDLELLQHPHALVAWMSQYHRHESRLPDELRAKLVEGLKAYPIYQNWDIDRLIMEAQAFYDFIQTQWQFTIENSLSGSVIQEAGLEYQLTFDRDPKLQDLLPALVRYGALRPLEVDDQKQVPTWAHSGVTLVDARLGRFSHVMGDLDQRLRDLLAQADTHSHWHTVKGLARDWAELCSLIYQPALDILSNQIDRYHTLSRILDRFFVDWLQKNYSLLGAQRLPTPHHVHHIPHYLDHFRSLREVDRIVLLILDGLSLADWHIIHAEWRKKHPEWLFKTDSLLAQIPTITSLSRYGLVSGLRPADFFVGLAAPPSEQIAWKNFWSRQGIPETACGTLQVSFDRGIDAMPELEEPAIKLWCLVDDSLDKLAHHATLGTKDQQASLHLWLDHKQEQNSAAIEKMIDHFLDRGFAVFIASDHGHVEAVGIGKPSQGIVAHTRGKRARLYSDYRAAQQVQNAFKNTIVWNNDGILPDPITALMPIEREAFALYGELVVTHGGITMDEVVVPFIQIMKAS